MNNPAFPLRPGNPATSVPLASAMHTYGDLTAAYWMSNQMAASYMPMQMATMPWPTAYDPRYAMYMTPRFTADGMPAPFLPGWPASTDATQQMSAMMGWPSMSKPLSTNPTKALQRSTPVPPQIRNSNLGKLVDVATEELMSKQHRLSGNKRSKDGSVIRPASIADTASIDSSKSVGTQPTTTVRVAFRLGGELVTGALALEEGQKPTIAYASAQVPDGAGSPALSTAATALRSRGRFGPQGWTPGKSKYSPIYHNDHAWAVAIKSTKVRFKFLAEAEAYYESFCKSVGADPKKKIRPQFDEDLHAEVLGKMHQMRLQAARTAHGSHLPEAELLKLPISSTLFNEGKVAERFVQEYLAGTQASV